MASAHPEQLLSNSNLFSAWIQTCCFMYVCVLLHHSPVSHGLSGWFEMFFAVAATSAWPAYLPKWKLFEIRKFCNAYHKIDRGVTNDKFTLRRFRSFPKICLLLKTGSQTKHGKNQIKSIQALKPALGKTGPKARSTSYSKYWTPVSHQKRLHQALRRQRKGNES